MERVGLVILLALGLGLCRGQDPEVLNMIQAGDAAFNKGKGSYPDAAAQYREALVALSTAGPDADPDDRMAIHALRQYSLAMRRAERSNEAHAFLSSLVDGWSEQDQLAFRARLAFEQGKTDPSAAEAIAHYERGVGLARQAGLCAEELGCLRSMASTYGRHLNDLETSRVLYARLHRGLPTCVPVDTASMVATSATLAAIYGSQGVRDSAQYYLTYGTDLLGQFRGSLDARKRYTYHQNWGVAHAKLGRFDLAIAEQSKAWRTAREWPASATMSWGVNQVLANLMLNNLRIGDLQGAFAYAEQAEDYFRDHLDPAANNHDALIRSLSIMLGNKALLLERSGDPDGAMEARREALSVLDRSGLPEDEARAHRHLDLALAYFSDPPGTRAASKHADSALHHLDALSIGPEVAHLRLLAAAVRASARAIANEPSGPDELDRVRDQAIALADTTALDPGLLVEWRLPTSEVLASGYLAVGKAGGDVAALKQVLAIVDEAASQIDQAMRGMDATWSAQLVQDRYRIQQLGLEAAFLMQDERAEAADLLGRMASQKALQFRLAENRKQQLGLADEDRLNELAKAKLQLAELSVAGTDDPATLQARSVAIARVDSILATVEHRPVRERTPGTLITEVQAELKADEAVLVLEPTRTELLGVLVQQHALRLVVHVPGHTALHDQVNRLVSRLREGGEDTELASALGQQLLAGLHPMDGMNHLRIIPSVDLAMLPFELLPLPGGELLGDRFVVSYTNSLEEMILDGIAPGNGQLIAFAPAFPATSTGNLPPLISDLRSATADRAFAPLVNNQDEARTVAGLFRAHLAIGDEASLAQFMDLAPGAGAIHLATHAFSHATDPRLSGILFHGTDGGEVLEGFRIEHLPLSADLVVLSACETGIGTPRPGEGVISLAREFQYAGARSVVMSLWQVDDLATRQIMERFYHHLAEGLGKADALAAAKRWYRMEYPDEPASKWAAFVLVGDNAPVRLRKPSSGTPWAVGIIVAVVLAGGVWLRRRSRSA